MTSCIVCDLEEDAEYAVKVVTSWKDLDSWNEAKNGEAAQELAGDVKNFTDVTPIMLVGKVLS